MCTIYIEFLSELKILLEEVENSWWCNWMQKSIDKYNLNQDVSHFLSAFGGCGSFNDEPIASETTRVLTNIIYSMAKCIQQQGNFDLASILQEEKNYQIKALDYSKNQKDYWNKEKDIDSHIKELNYINYVIENYSVGNLHQITTEYLEQKNISVGKK